LKEKRENSLNTDIEREKTRKGKRKKRKENGSICPLITMISQRQTQS
jgi:hypothetical protein